MARFGSFEFGQELLHYLDSLYSLAMILARNQELAEELVQQTCLKALENYQRFQKNTNLKAWLFTILRNSWLNQYRNNKSHPHVTLEENCFPAEEKQNEFELKMIREEIRRAFFSLPILHRETLFLRDIEGLSYQEIAIVLSCPLGTVMSRINRARSLLRNQLSGVMKTKNAEL